MDEIRPDAGNVVPIRKNAIKSLTNYELFKTTERNRIIETRIGVEAPELRKRLDAVVANWPRRVAGRLFITKGGIRHWIKTPADLISWVSGEDVVVDWRERIECALTKSEFYSYLTRAATNYSGVSELPHFPPADGYFYLTPALPDAEGALEELLGFFKPASENDGLLIKAAFMTLFWGGPPGARPAFVFTAEGDDQNAGRGVGKTTLTDVMAALAGGSVDFSPKKLDGEDMKKRLITSNGERIVRFDNVKSSRMSNADVESLITAQFISGHRMYSGSDRVPNYFTYLFTFNDVSFSKDMAQRAVCVRLARPEYDGNWQDKVMGFVERNRLRIIAGIRDLFSLPASEQKEFPRFSLWARDVLYRATDKTEVLAYISSAQGAMDADEDTSGEIRGCIEHNLSKYRIDKTDKGYNGPTSEYKGGFLLRKSLVHAWIKESLGRRDETGHGLAQLVRRAKLRNLIREHRYEGCDYYLWMMRIPDLPKVPIAPIAAFLVYDTPQVDAYVRKVVNFKADEG